MSFNPQTYETTRRKRYRDKLEILKGIITRAKQTSQTWYWTHVDVLDAAKEYIEELKQKLAELSEQQSLESRRIRIVHRIIQG